MTIKQCEERNKAIIDSLKDWIKGKSSIDGYLELAIICEHFNIRIPKAASNFISSENPNDVKASGNIQTFKTLFSLMDKIKMAVEEATP